MKVGSRNNVVPVEDFGGEVAADLHGNNLWNATANHVANRRTSQIVEQESFVFRVMSLAIFACPVAQSRCNGHRVPCLTETCGTSTRIGVSTEFFERFRKGLFRIRSPYNARPGQGGLGNNPDRDLTTPECGTLRLWGVLNWRRVYTTFLEKDY
jgi:hypothetical protein